MNRESSEKQRGCFICEGTMRFIPGQTEGHDLDGWHCPDCDTWEPASDPEPAEPKPADFGYTQAILFDPEG